MVCLRAPLQRFGEARRADGSEHELLEVDVAVGVRAAVQHVHERHRQHVRVGTTEVAVERQLGLRRGRVGDRERNAEDGVGAETGFAFGAVQQHQLFVEEPLLVGLEPDDRVGDLRVHVLDRGTDTLAAVALATVAQLGGLVGSRARAARHDGASCSA